jgi:hypothetical protein
MLPCTRYQFVATWRGLVLWYGMLPAAQHRVLLTEQFEFNGFLK